MGKRTKYLPEKIPLAELIGVWYKVPDAKAGLMRRIKLDGEK